MKKLLILCVMLCGWMTTHSAESQAAVETRYVFGISPFLERGAKDEVYRSVVSFILEGMPLNSSLVLCDAYNLKTITTVKIPELTAFNSGKTRVNQTRDQVQKLRTFLAAEYEQPVVPKVSFTNAVRMPQFLDFVAENYRPTNANVRILMAGTPLYADAKEIGFSMVNGFFPSDGHLAVDREKSVFGVKGRSSALTGMDLHFAVIGDPWVSELHREKISRFWSLFLKGQGSRLVSMGSDLTTLFKALNDPGKTPSSDQYKFEVASTKLEMLRLTRDVGVSDWISKDVVAVSTERPSKTVGPMKIGIRWKGDLDLDLYAAAHDSAETLYFEHTRSPEGYYFKDHRSSPEREYEFIEFETPVDLWKVRARVNFFEGHSRGGARGEVRVEFDGKIYSADFKIKGEHGNEGRESERQTAFWAELDIPQILRMRSPDQAVSGR